MLPIRRWSNAMDTTQTARVCKDVEHAAAQIRNLIGDRTGILEMLDRFRLLADFLNRLVDVVDRERGDVSQCRSIIRNVVGTLQSPQV
jgi:hypothetical protein